METLAINVVNIAQYNVTYIYNPMAHSVSLIAHLDIGPIWDPTWGRDQWGSLHLVGGLPMYKILVSSNNTNPLINSQQTSVLYKLTHWSNDTNHSNGCKNRAGLFQGCPVVVLHLDGTLSGPHNLVCMMCTNKRVHTWLWGSLLVHPNGLVPQIDYELIRMVWTPIKCVGFK